MHQSQVELSVDMREIITEALSAGACASAEEAILLALRDWWSHQLILSAGDRRVRGLLEAAISDTRPGRPADEIFSELLEQYSDPRHVEGRADAA